MTSRFYLLHHYVSKALHLHFFFLVTLYPAPLSVSSVYFGDSYRLPSLPSCLSASSLFVSCFVFPLPIPTLSQFLHLRSFFYLLRLPSRSPSPPFHSFLAAASSSPHLSPPIPTLLGILISSPLSLTFFFPDFYFLTLLLLSSCLYCSRYPILSIPFTTIFLPSTFIVYHLSLPYLILHSLHPHYYHLLAALQHPFSVHVPPPHHHSSASSTPLSPAGLHQATRKATTVHVQTCAIVMTFISA